MDVILGEYRRKGSGFPEFVCFGQTPLKSGIDETGWKPDACRRVC
jgi:hypothetical protein